MPCSRGKDAPPSPPFPHQPPTTHYHHHQARSGSSDSSEEELGHRFVIAMLWQEAK